MQRGQWPRYQNSKMDLSLLKGCYDGLSELVVEQFGSDREDDGKDSPAGCLFTNNQWLHDRAWSTVGIGDGGADCLRCGDQL